MKYETTRRRLVGFFGANKSLREITPGEHFFGQAHTLANYETAYWESELADNDAFELWSENGARDMAYRANLRWKKLLADYQAPALDASVDEALLDFISKKKAACADAWY